MKINENQNKKHIVHPLTLDPGGDRLIIEFLDGSSYRTHDRVKHPKAYVNAVNRNKPSKIASYEGAVMFSSTK